MPNKPVFRPIERLKRLFTSSTPPSQIEKEPAKASLMGRIRAFLGLKSFSTFPEEYEMDSVRKGIYERKVIEFKPKEDFNQAVAEAVKRNLMALGKLDPNFENFAPKKLVVTLDDGKLSTLYLAVSRYLEPYANEKAGFNPRKEHKIPVQYQIDTDLLYNEEKSDIRQFRESNKEYLAYVMTQIQKDIAENRLHLPDYE